MNDITTPIVQEVSEENLTKQGKKIFQAMKKKNGKVPKWMRVMGNCEDTLTGFFSLFTSIMDDAPTERELKWKIAYVVSELNKCHYCVSVSAKQLENMGMDKQSMKEIEKACQPAECVALEYAKAMTTAAYKIDDELIRQMKQYFTDQQIVEISSVVGLFNYINRFNDALRIFPEP